MLKTKVVLEMSYMRLQDLSVKKKTKTLRGAPNKAFCRIQILFHLVKQKNLQQKQFQE